MCNFHNNSNFSVSLTQWLVFWEFQFDFPGSYRKFCLKSMLVGVVVYPIGIDTGETVYSVTTEDSEAVVRV